MAQPSLDTSPYLQTIGNDLHRGISIFWTGPKVVSRRITSSHLAEVHRVLKRRVTIWENLNANDYDQRRLCLGPLAGRSSDLIEELNGMLINPNCEFELNFIPMNTLGQWFRSTPANPYQVEKALEKALSDWLDELKGLTLDDLRLLVDFFYLPYENGRQAQRLFNEFYWLRWNCEEKIGEEWKRRSSVYQEKVTEIGHFYERLIAMNNRAVLYDLYEYIQDLNACISLSEQFLQWVEERDSTSSSIFMSGDVEPWAIRGALAGDFLSLLPLGHSQSLFKPTILNSTSIFFIRPIDVDEGRGFLAETNEEKLCATITWSVGESVVDYSIRVQLTVDATVKREEIFQVTSKLFALISKDVLRLLENEFVGSGRRGCYAWVEEGDVFLHQCYTRLGFLDIPSMSLLMNNGLRIPQFALGTYKIAENQVSQVISRALQVGYRHFDCAWIYQNEKSIGDCLAKEMSEGRVKREDLFITGKLWCSFHRFERVREQCLISLRDLQCDYLDLFLIHWPFAFVDQDPNVADLSSVEVDDEIDFLDCWKAMEGLVDEGLVKSIGLSNFTEEQMERILAILIFKFKLKKRLFSS